MDKNGFSLIELVLVVAILSALLVIATLQFNVYSRKTGIERQTREMFADLMSVRSQALFEKRDRAVKITATSFTVYSSNLTTGTPVLQRTLNNSVVTSGGLPYTVIFNSRGMIDGVNNDSICIDPDNNPGASDSLVIFTTRIQMGKRNAGTCSATNITTR